MTARTSWLVAILETRVVAREIDANKGGKEVAELLEVRVLDLNLIEETNELDVFAEDI